MRRVTTKLDNGFYVCQDKIMTWEGGIRQTQILGIYEDIEEELGCPLEVLFKALKTTVFTNAEDCYGQELPSGLREFEVRLNVKNMSLGLIHNSMFKGKEVIRHIPLKDYKKTWWLKEDKSE